MVILWNRISIMCFINQDNIERNEGNCSSMECVHWVTIGKTILNISSILFNNPIRNNIFSCLRTFFKVWMEHVLDTGPMLREESWGYVPYRKYKLAIWTTKSKKCIFKTYLLYVNNMIKLKRNSTNFNYI